MQKRAKVKVKTQSSAASSWSDQWRSAVSTGQNHWAASAAHRIKQSMNQIKTFRDRNWHWQSPHKCLCWETNCCCLSDINLTLSSQTVGLVCLSLVLSPPCDICCVFTHLAAAVFLSHVICRLCCFVCLKLSDLVETKTKPQCARCDATVTHHAAVLFHYLWIWLIYTYGFFFHKLWFLCICCWFYSSVIVFLVRLVDLFVWTFRKRFLLEQILNQVWFLLSFQIWLQHQ